MPNPVPTEDSIAFGKRLVALMAHAGHDRQGAGAYLAKQYKVSTVTANAWLNGDHKCSSARARRIAQDQGCTFESLYFGPKLVFLDDSRAVRTRVEEPAPIPYGEQHREIAELRAVTSLTAKALAATIQPAGKELRAALKRFAAHRHSEFVAEVIAAIESELPDQHAGRSAKGSNRSKHR